MQQENTYIRKFNSKDLSGRDILIYAKIADEKIDALENKIKNSEVFTIPEFGEIIASCYGIEPTEKIKAKLKDEYNYIV